MENSVQEALAAANVAPVTTETPTVTPREPTAETPKTETPEAPAEVAEAPKEEELYDLPDGRKVTGKQLHDIHVNQLLPEFTRKSQELSKLKTPVQPRTETEPEWKKADWEPKTYQEILDAAKHEVLDHIESQNRKATQEREQASQWVQSQLDEIKKDEPNVSEELLFQHANKYGFADLKTAYQNMKDFNIAVKATEQKVIKNLKAREVEPIAAKPTAGTQSDALDYHFDRGESAVDVLSRIKGN